MFIEKVDFFCHYIQKSLILLKIVLASAIIIVLENKLSKRMSMNASASETFVIKPPNYKGKAVNKINGRKTTTPWC